jgi:hypothetical protein
VLHLRTLLIGGKREHEDTAAVTASFSNIGLKDPTPRKGLAVIASTYIGLDGLRYASA